MSRRVYLGVRTVAASMLAAAVLFLPSAASAQTTVRISGPTEQVDDARIQGGSLADKVFDNEPLATKVHPSSATYHRRSVLKFDTHNTVPRGATVQSAILTLTVRKSDPGTRKLGLYRLSQTFDEDGASWNTRQRGSRWRTAGGDFDQKFAEASVGSTAGAKINFDITALVQGVVAEKYGSSRYTRIGLKDLGSGSDTSYKEFYNSEVSDSSKRPVLTVVYGGSGSGDGDGGSDDAPTGSLPSGWQSRDIGSVGQRGAASASGSSFTVSGAGADVWGRADAFHYVYRSLSGDGTITAEVAAISGAEDWTKVGVMMRGSTSSGAAQAFMLVSKRKGMAFQRRTVSGGSTAHTTAGTGTAPRWVRLARAGRTITAYGSKDGSSWIRIGSATFDIPSTILVGLAVSSHDTGRLATASFESVKFVTGTPSAPAPADTDDDDDDDEPEPAPAPTGSTLKVLHWNIHRGYDTDNDYNLTTIGSWLAKMSPSIISLNEVHNDTGYTDDNQPAKLKAMLESKTGKRWYSYYRTTQGSSRGNGNLILSRFPISSTGYCQLDSARVAAQVTVTVNGRNVNFYSTHLDSADSSSRRIAETKVLVKCLDNDGEQKIVAGDFNAQASSTEIAIMKNDYIDAWAKADANDDASSYSGNSRWGATRNSRIDYVFYSKSASRLSLKSAQVVDTRDSSGDMPSDHKPLIVTFTVQ
jgi:endonuclease/exonuclease/phosphatase family metal-dependent hydrolase